MSQVSGPRSAGCCDRPHRSALSFALHRETHCPLARKVQAMRACAARWLVACIGQEHGWGSYCCRPDICAGAGDECAHAWRVRVCTGEGGAAKGELRCRDGMRSVAAAAGVSWHAGCSTDVGPPPYLPGPLRHAGAESGAGGSWRPAGRRHCLICGSSFGKFHRPASYTPPPGPIRNPHSCS